MYVACAASPNTHCLEVRNNQVCDLFKQPVANGTTILNLIFASTPIKTSTQRAVLIQIRPAT